MTPGYIGNRHAGRGCLGQYRQLLIQRVPPTTLDPGEHFHSINRTRHSRTPRLTPSLSLCGYVRSKRGLLHPAISADGRYVSFLCYLNLGVDGNEVGDIFVKDLHLVEAQSNPITQSSIRSRRDLCLSQASSFH